MEGERGACVRIPGVVSWPSPVRVAVTLLQKLDDLWHRVGGISGAHQVQQDFPSILVINHAGQGTDDFLDNANKPSTVTPFQRATEI